MTAFFFSLSLLCFVANHPKMHDWINRFLLLSIQAQASTWLLVVEAFFSECSQAMACWTAEHKNYKSSIRMHQILNYYLTWSFVEMQNAYRMWSDNCIEIGKLRVFLFCFFFCFFIMFCLFVIWKARKMLYTEATANELSTSQFSGRPVVPDYYYIVTRATFPDFSAFKLWPFENKGCTNGTRNIRDQNAGLNCGIHACVCVCGHTPHAFKQVVFG